MFHRMFHTMKGEEMNETLDVDLDIAVAEAIGWRFQLMGGAWWQAISPDGKTLTGFNTKRDTICGIFEPSTNWAHGGPIIDNERICIIWSAGKPNASVYEPGKIVHWHTGHTPLKAAMRAYLAFKKREASIAEQKKQEPQVTDQNCPDESSPVRSKFSWIEAAFNKLSVLKGGN